MAEKILEIKRNDIKKSSNVKAMQIERFDYTEWRRKYFANMNLETLNKEAVKYGKAHPFCGKK